LGGGTGVSPLSANSLHFHIFLGFYGEAKSIPHIFEHSVAECSGLAGRFVREMTAMGLRFS
jgi:hypothetical protein